MTPKEISIMIEENASEPLAILKKLNGFYECPKGKDGERLGPLVGYAGKYEAPDGTKKQFVGDVYLNCSVAEQYPVVMHTFAKQLQEKLKDILNEVDVIVGPQMGGIAIAQMLAFVAEKKFAYIEKKVTQVATETLREQAELKLIRHTINPGEKVLIMEDVLNNFSTAGETIEMLEGLHGAKVTAIACLLNRSLTIDKEFTYKERQIPIFALIRKEITEWKQEDVEVVNDIQNKNVILKPKNDWGTLVKAMTENAK